MAEQEIAVPPEIYKGLAGVPVDYTAISKVNPESNSLLYRGYPVQELAASTTFEEVAYLLWYGELPDDTQLAEFEERERSLRGLDHEVKRIIDELPLTAHPMDVVRTAVSVIGASDPATPTTASTPTSTSRSACSRSCRRSSRTTSGVGTSSSSSSRGATSASRRTSSGRRSASCRSCRS